MPYHILEIILLDPAVEHDKNDAPNLLAKRKALGDHILEVTGKKIRDMFEHKG